MFKTYLQYINELESGGAEAGILDLTKVSYKVVKNFAEELFEKHGRVLDVEIPNFEKNFNLAKSKFLQGKTERKDMPVIATADVKLFQQRLERGMIDINNPYAFTTDPKNPFPEGLTGKQAKDFLEAGWKDDESSDDVINVFPLITSAKDLYPIQRQAYIDKSLEKIAKDGAEGCRSFLVERKLIASIDDYIIDGHHRFLTALLLDPNMKLQGIRIDLDIDTLKKLALAYGDAIGNKRNK